MTVGLFANYVKRNLVTEMKWLNIGELITQVEVEQLVPVVAEEEVGEDLPCQKERQPEVEEGVEEEDDKKVRKL